MENLLISLTLKEAQIVAKFLRETSISGTVETLPASILEIVTILRKLDAAFTSQKKEETHDNQTSQGSNGEAGSGDVRSPSKPGSD